MAKRMSHKRALQLLKQIVKHEQSDVRRRLPNKASRAAQQFISSKVSRLAHEGVPAPQRVAAAYSMARQKGLKTNPRNCYAVIDYGVVVPSLGFRYAVQCLPDRPLQVPSGVTILVRGMSRAGARAMADHLNAQAKGGRVRNRPFLRGGPRGAFFQVRRSNPVLAVMGGNPPHAAGDDLVATWANIEYRRPDDPDGKRAVRVHEFPDGFVATPLADGSILLVHPRGLNLWTRR